MIVRPAALACVAALALAASPAQPDVTPEKTVTVTLANFHFSPGTIPLVHGQAYALEIVNEAAGGHDFAAPQFFAAAEVAPADRARVVKGRIEVPGGERITVHLVAPAAGRFPLRCSHFLHSSFGMTGTIVVS